MAPTVKPLRLQIIERVVAKLKTIAAGTTYWYGAPHVLQQVIHPAEVEAEVTYCVTAGEGGGSITVEGAAGDGTQYWEDFIVAIKGYIRTDGNPAEALEKAIHDVRTAIDEDSRDRVTAGSLGNLAIAVTLERSPETDNGYGSVVGLGFFDLQVRVRIEGTYAEL